MLETAPPTETPGITRRRFIQGGLLAAGALSLGSYATLIEPNHIVTRYLDIHLKRLPPAFDGLRIAQISDIHYGEFLGEDHLKAVISRINAEKVDLLVITGDFVTRKWGHHRGDRNAALKSEPCAALLRTAQSRLGAIAVLGNHDHATNPDIVTNALSSHGIRVLRNQATNIEAANSRLWFAGVDDACEFAADLRGTMAQVPPDEACIVLVHEPDMADWTCKYHADLQLSGHSHGGQVRIPFLGAPVLPNSGRKYPLGHYHIANLQLYTNPGIGVITLPIRFDCPPEITIFTLHSQPPSS